MGILSSRRQQPFVLPQPVTAQTQPVTQQPATYAPSLIKTEDLKKAQTFGTTYQPIAAPTTGPGVTQAKAGFLAPAASGPATRDATATRANLASLDPAAGYDAMMVSDRMAAIQKQGNPLFDMARTGAAQEANKRGLLNSSMGVQAGEAAVIGASYNIANADAGFENRSREFNAGQKNEFALKRFSDANAMESTNANNATSISKSNADAFNTSTRDLFAAQERAKETNANNETAISRSNADAANTAERDLFNSKTQIGINNANNQLSADMAEAQAKNAAETNFASTANNAIAANTTAQNEAAAQAADAANKEAMQAAEIAANKALAVMDNEQKKWMAQFDANHKTLMNTSELANTAYTEAMNYIAAIQTDDTLAAGAKQAAINQQFSALQDQFTIIETLNGVDLGDISLGGTVVGGTTGGTNTGGTSVPFEWSSIPGAIGGTTRFGGGSKRTQSSLDAAYSAYKTSGGSLGPNEWWTLIEQPRINAQQGNNG